MDRLWVKGVETYGHKWITSYGETPEPDHAWALGLADLTPQQIGIGVRKMIASGDAWPPTLPEFKALCIPTAEDLGLPPLLEAYRNACDKAYPTGSDKPWLHPVVVHVTTEVGYWNIWNLPERDSLKLFERAYEIACRDFMAGKEFEPIPEALTDGVPSRKSEPHVGNAALAAMRNSRYSPNPKQQSEK